MLSPVVGVMMRVTVIVALFPRAGPPFPTTSISTAGSRIETSGIRVIGSRHRCRDKILLSGVEFA